MPTSHLRLSWRDGAPVPPRAADPSAPHGTILAGPPIDPTAVCWTLLPSPASGPGAWIVECPACGIGVACAATGGPDDPHAVRLPCRPVERAA